MQSFDGYIQIQQELERAEKARVNGNEGMARVCARRAAGIAAGEYIKRRGFPVTITSAYDRLRYLSKNGLVPEDIRQVSGFFLVRITPDHTLPVEVDLIEQAHLLISKLLDPAA